MQLLLVVAFFVYKSPLFSLTKFIPGAGFIKAIMVIKDLIVSFVESAMMLIPAITEEMEVEVIMFVAIY